MDTASIDVTSILQRTWIFFKESSTSSLVGLLKRQLHFKIYKHLALGEFMAKFFLNISQEFSRDSQE